MVQVPPSTSRLSLWVAYVAALIVAVGLTLRWWPLPALDRTALSTLSILGAATLAAEVFTIDFRDRKHVSAGCIFPLVASAVVFPQGGMLVAGAAGFLAGLQRGTRWRSALLHGAQLALAAAAAAGVELAIFGAVPLELSVNGLLAVLLFVALYTTVAWLLGQIDELILGQPADHAGVDLLTNLLLVPLPLALAVVYERTGANGLLLSCLALALLLIVVRAYVNLHTLHVEVEQAYVQLAEKDERLEKALQANRDMSQVVSHDLRGPLTSVMGYAELLRGALDKRELEPSRLLRYVDSIEGNSRRILTLADKLLDLHRLEEGGAVELAQIDAAAVLREVLDDMRVRAEQKEVTLELRVEPGLPAFRTSEWMFREIAENLMSNAIKYSREGGQVAASVRVVDAELLLEVQDQGIGMSATDQQRLFTKFFRSGDEAVRAVHGAGLGLALTRTMIERLGGRVEVWSELGRGSRFSVYLPWA